MYNFIAVVVFSVISFLFVENSLSNGQSVLQISQRLGVARQSSIESLPQAKRLLLLSLSTLQDLRRM